jgi:hypothetical protein
VLAAGLCMLASIDNDMDAVVGDTSAPASSGNQVSLFVAQINIVSGCTSGNASSSISVPSASEYTVMVSSSDISSFLFAFNIIMRNIKVHK